MPGSLLDPVLKHSNDQTQDFLLQLKLFMFDLYFENLDITETV